MRDSNGETTPVDAEDPPVPHFDVWVDGCVCLGCALARGAGLGRWTGDGEISWL